MYSIWNDVTLFQSHPRGPKVVLVLLFVCVTRIAIITAINRVLQSWYHFCLSEKIDLLKHCQVLPNTSPNGRDQTFTQLQNFENFEEFMYNLLTNFPLPFVIQEVCTQLLFNQSHICLYWKQNSTYQNFQKKLKSSLSPCLSPQLGQRPPAWPGHTGHHNSR